MILRLPKTNQGQRPTPQRSDPPLPSVARMAVNYAKSTARHVMNQGKLRSPEEVERIISTYCNASPTPCEHYRKFDGRCAKCGCPLKRKVIREIERCPIGKW